MSAEQASTAPCAAKADIAAAPSATVIRAGALEGFRSLLLELGCDPAAILEQAGLSDDILDRPDTIITTAAYRKALNLAALAAGLRHFGLLLSQRQTFEKLGAVGYLVRHAPDLETSIERLMRHFRTHDTGSMTQLEVDGDCALWRHGLSGVADDSAIQQTELAVGLACRFVRSALSETWAPEAIYFEHGAPQDKRPYDAVFRCPVLFNQAVTGLEFARSDLALPLRLSDAGLFAILEQHVSQIEQGLGEDLRTRVRQALQQNIEAGKHRIDDIAALLKLKRHTLQRRLKREGTSFQAILDDVRYDMGRRSLRETNLPVSEIASILGYAESAVFTRAFARRSGITPRAWRQGQATR